MLDDDPETIHIQFTEDSIAFKFTPTETIINDHLLLEDGSWQCIKDECGFVVRPEWRGHRCMFRPEMYTLKPEIPFREEQS